MKYGVPTTSTPTDPNAIYMRIAYATFFFGPFLNEQDVVSAMNAMDEANPYWDYDGAIMLYGLNPLPKDMAFGFPSVPREIEDRIQSKREIAVNPVKKAAKYNAPAK